jgi:hypothetical protein
MENRPSLKRLTDKGKYESRESIHVLKIHKT